MKTTYEEDQINIAKTNHDWKYKMHIKIQGRERATNWMAITQEQLEKIKEILKTK